GRPETRLGVLRDDPDRTQKAGATRLHGFGAGNAAATRDPGRESNSGSVLGPATAQARSPAPQHGVGCRFVDSRYHPRQWRHDDLGEDEMMAFADSQLKLLDGKLPEKHVKTRVQRGLTLSYIEGWHAIAEANRIFGFDGWDREMIEAECVWQDGRGATKLCAYTARVRIRVRAGGTVIQRDGSGVGQGSGTTMGEAHESALKEAETDATKRALTTFGNLFGLALYDREQAGVRRTPRPRDHSALVTDQSEPWVMLGSRGEIIGQHETAESFCTGLKRGIDQALLPRALKSLLYYNEPTIQRLRLARPELKTAKGVHYADLLERYADRAKQRLGQTRRKAPEPELIPPEP